MAEKPVGWLLRVRGAGLSGTHGPVTPTTREAKTGSEIQGLPGLQRDLNQPKVLSEIVPQGVAYNGLGGKGICCQTNNLSSVPQVVI